MLKAVRRLLNNFLFHNAFIRPVPFRRLLALLACLGMFINPWASLLLAAPPQVVMQSAEMRNLALAIIAKTQANTVYIDGMDIVTWNEDGMRIFLSKDKVRIRFNDRSMEANSGVIWFDEVTAKERHTIRLTFYLEGDVLVREGRSEVVSNQLFFRLSNVLKIVIDDDDHRIPEFSKEVQCPLLKRAREVYRKGLAPRREEAPPAPEKAAPEVEAPAEEKAAVEEEVEEVVPPAPVEKVEEEEVITEEAPEKVEEAVVEVEKEEITPPVEEKAPAPEEEAVEVEAKPEEVVEEEAIIEEEVTEAEAPAEEVAPVVAPVEEVEEEAVVTEEVSEEVEEAIVEVEKEEVTPVAEEKPAVPEEEAVEVEAKPEEVVEEEAIIEEEVTEAEAPAEEVAPVVAPVEEVEEEAVVTEEVSEEVEEAIVEVEKEEVTPVAEEKPAVPEKEAPEVEAPVEEEVTVEEKAAVGEEAEKIEEEVAAEEAPEEIAPPPPVEKVEEEAVVVEKVLEKVEKVLREVEKETAAPAVEEKAPAPEKKVVEVEAKPEEVVEEEAPAEEKAVVEEEAEEVVPVAPVKKVKEEAVVTEAAPEKVEEVPVKVEKEEVTPVAEEKPAVPEEEAVEVEAKPAEVVEEGPAVEVEKKPAAPVPVEVPKKKIALPPRPAISRAEVEEMTRVSVAEARIDLPVEPPLFIYASDPEGFRTESWEEEDGTRIVVLTGGVDIVTREYKIKPEYQYRLFDVAPGDVSEFLSTLPEDEVDVTDIEMVADNIVLMMRDMTEDEAQLYAGGKKGRKYIEAYAEGNVFIYEDGLTMKAPRIFYDKTAKKGIIIDGEIKAYSATRAIPMVYEAKQIKRASKNVFMAKDAMLSITEMGKPNVWFACKKMTITGEGEDRIATTTHNAIFVEGVPVFYWPVFKTRLQGESAPLRRIHYSSSSSFGNRVQTIWDLFALGVDSSRIRSYDKWSNLYLTLDFLEARGMGIGLDFEYARAESQGFFTSYFIDDHGEDFKDQLRKRDERGRFRWQHRQQLLEDLQLDVEFSYISDAGFLDEYFEREAKEEKEQETYIYLKYTPADFAALTFLFRPRTNNFQNYVEYQPQVGVNIIGYPVSLGAHKFTFYNDTELANVRTRYRDPLDMREPRAYRSDTRNEIEYPFSIGPVNVVPYAGARLSYYDATWVKGTSERWALSYGLRASSRLHRIYDYENDLLNIHKVRHIIIPDFEMRRVYGVDLRPTDVFPNDAVDDVDNLDMFSFGVRQRWQTKRSVRSGNPEAPAKLRVEDLALFDLEVSVYPNHERDNAGKSLSNFEWRAEYYFSNRVALLSDGEFDFRDSRWEVINVGLRVNQSPKMSFYVGNRYAEDAGSSILILRTDYKVNERWSLGYYEQHDYNQQRAIARSVFFQRRFDQWLGQFSIVQDEGENGGAGETTYFVQFTPVGVPEFKLRF